MNVLFQQWNGTTNKLNKKIYFWEVLVWTVFQYIQKDFTIQKLLKSFKNLLLKLCGLDTSISIHNPIILVMIKWDPWNLVVDQLRQYTVTNYILRKIRLTYIIWDYNKRKFFVYNSQNWWYLKRLPLTCYLIHLKQMRYTIKLTYMVTPWDDKRKCFLISTTS